MLDAFVNLQIVADVVLATTFMLMVVFFHNRNCVEIIDDSINELESVTSSINEITNIIGTENFSELNKLCEPMLNLVTLELPLIINLPN